MYDLIYAGGDIEDIIGAKYLEAKIKDASDDIHLERFECEIDGIGDDEFYIFAIQSGFATYCFGFSLMMHDCPKGANQKVWDWIAEAEALKKSEKE